VIIWLGERSMVVVGHGSGGRMFEMVDFDGCRWEGEGEILIFPRRP
jgi:hypothetical protein